MRGLMFTGFAEWVESTRGLQVLDEVYTSLGTRLSSGGAYTSVGNYPSAELHYLAQALGDMEGREADQILVDFGEAAFPALVRLAPETVAQCSDVEGLLEIIESVIHTEVRKLHSDAQPPLIASRRLVNGDLEVTYSSHRDFTYLCRGLILGAARWFDADATVRVISKSQKNLQTVSVLEVSGWRHV